MNLFCTKSIEQMRETAAHSGMAKTLGAVDLILLGIGCVIGTGIFVLTGVAAAKYAGPAVTISFMISGLACALAGLAYAEFSSIVPASGSAYTYTYASLGEFIAFIVGWNLILEYTVTASAVASGWSGYVTGLLLSAGIDPGHALTHVPADGGIINIPAIFITLLLSVLLIRGTQESTKLNRFLVGVKLTWGGALDAVRRAVFRLNRAYQRKSGAGHSRAIFILFESQAQNGGVRCPDRILH